MLLDKNLHKRIMEEGKEIFEMLEEYDKTREWPLGRERIDITLSKRIIEKLNGLKKKTGKPISRIIEDAVAKL